MQIASRFGHTVHILVLMELATPPSSRCSVQEYFRLAKASPTKLEYKAGQIIDMAGASYEHNRIAANILGELRNRLKDQPFSATGSDTRVQVAVDHYCYPDVTVVCGEPAFDPLDRGSTMTNPQIFLRCFLRRPRLPIEGKNSSDTFGCPRCENIFWLHRKSRELSRLCDRRMALGRSAQSQKE
jgi:hypothetical protein